ncbi:YlmC/YmxH family sporulation protein [Gracilibacillus halotolerans]|uniref:YlmC/YmxH family sporulation protein n=1 Tax=Gracilibacillus halotolerans TaxID=74386 RepID=A0A841RIQ7_9BACI|nr:YlmC/YmxH family sporulation protein [Gracilibacillus halotolerans]MBB6511366.1 YlmC/YmxH family sporulation protein [Gracilibacillus halotolerans]
MVTLSQLQMKDIVFMEDGTRIGNLSDIDINVETGKVISLVVTTKAKVLGVFGESREIIIPWNHVIKIGQDVILVRKIDSYTAIS